LSLCCERKGEQTSSRPLRTPYQTSNFQNGKKKKKNKRKPNTRQQPNVQATEDVEFWRFCRRFPATRFALFCFFLFVFFICFFRTIFYFWLIFFPLCCFILVLQVFSHLMNCIDNQLKRFTIAWGPSKFANWTVILFAIFVWA
jgi:hypothetical protein